MRLVTRSTKHTYYPCIYDPSSYISASSPLLSKLLIFSNYCIFFRRLRNFHVKNNSCKKIFMLINVCSSFDAIFFNGWLLHYGRVPAAFLAFSLLPGVGRASYRCVAVRSSRQSDVYFGRCGRVLLFVDHHCVNVFIRVSNFVVNLNREIILTAKFSQSMVVFIPYNK